MPPAHSAPAADAAAPLRGRRIVVTRPGVQGERLSAALEAAGAEAPVAPLTRIELLDREGLAWRLASRQFDWVLFTSANAVRAAADAARLAQERAEAAAGDKGAVRARARAGSHSPFASILGDALVAAVGRVTAEALHDHGVDAVVTPGQFDAESLLEELSRREDVRGARVLHPAAAGAREVLSEGLSALGAKVETVIAYRSAPDPAGARALRAALETYRTDLVTFFAPSAVEAYVAALGDARAREIPAASVGPVTTAALSAHGIPVAIEAEEATAARLVEAITAHYIRSHAAPRPA